jgi:nucleoside-diphosphate kinase
MSKTSINHTFCMLKPDICNRNLIGACIKTLEENSFKIIKMEMKYLSTDQVMEFYKDHKEKSFFPQMVERIANKPMVGCILEYLQEENAVIFLRKLMGHTNPANAEEGTIRHTYGISIDENCIHGSDSLENVQRESELFFTRDN